MKRAAAIAAYLAALLAVDTQASLHQQFALGALTWIVLVLFARLLPIERRAQVAVVICAATVAELTGSIIWGVYTYRLHNLPTFVPPAHGLVFMAGLSLSDALRRHTLALVGVAAALVVLGRGDVVEQGFEQRLQAVGTTRDVELDFAGDLREGAQVRRELHPDHRRVWTSTERTAGRSRTIGAQESPASAEA